MDKYLFVGGPLDGARIDTREAKTWKTPVPNIDGHHMGATIEYKLMRFQDADDSILAVYSFEKTGVLQRLLDGYDPRTISTED